jgi:hypothetical protein
LEAQPAASVIETSALFGPAGAADGVLEDPAAGADVDEDEAPVFTAQADMDTNTSAATPAGRNFRAARR